MPNLSENVYQPGDALPTLAVTLGVPSSSLDMDSAQEAIFASVSQGQFTVDLTPFITPLSPLSVSAADILEQVAVAPVDARVDAATGNVTPGSYGISCDEAALEALLTKAQPGQTVRIAMEAVAPTILGEEVYFQDVLGFCQTPHNDNEKRNTNLTLACKALNGVVLQPGQELSYNETLGQRTEAAGYQKAPAYSGTELVDSLGGGHLPGVLHPVPVFAVCGNGHCRPGQPRLPRQLYARGAGCHRQLGQPGSQDFQSLLHPREDCG